MLIRVLRTVVSATTVEVPDEYPHNAHEEAVCRASDLAQDETVWEVLDVSYEPLEPVEGEYEDGTAEGGPGVQEKAPA